jgi:hypothetical protein
LRACYSGYALLPLYSLRAYGASDAIRAVWADRACRACIAARACLSGYALWAGRPLRAYISDRACFTLRASESKCAREPVCSVESVRRDRASHADAYAVFEHIGVKREVGVAGDGVRKPANGTAPANFRKVAAVSVFIKENAIKWGHVRLYLVGRDCLTAEHINKLAVACLIYA